MQTFTPHTFKKTKQKTHPSATERFPKGFPWPHCCGILSGNEHIVPPGSPPLCALVTVAAVNGRGRWEGDQPRHAPSPVHLNGSLVSHVNLLPGPTSRYTARFWFCFFFVVFFFFSLAPDSSGSHIWGVPNRNPNLHTSPCPLFP